MLDNNSKLKTFIVWSDKIEGRIDPFFYDPEIVRLLEQLKKKETYKLGDLISDISGGATPRVTEDFYLESGGVPFLRVQNITEEGIQLDDVKFIKPEVHQNQLKRSQLKAGDVVFTITGRIGSVAVVPDYFEGNINQHSVRFHLKEEVDRIEILPEYIAIYFNTDFGRVLSLRNVTGGTRPALDYVALRNLDVPLPAPAVQKKVIEKVQKVYEEKRKKEEQIQKILASIDDFVLGELGIEIPEGGAEQIYEIWSDSIEGRLDPMFFHPARLRAIEAIKKSGKKIASLVEIAEFRREIVGEIPEGAPYLGLENIASNSGEYVENGNKESVSSAFVFKQGDVLFPKLRPYLNKVFYADFDGVCSTEFHVLRAKECEPFYLFAFLSRSVVIKQTSRLMTGNTLPRLQTEDVENLLVPIPSKSKQKKIIDEVQSSYVKMRDLRVRVAEVLAAGQKQVEELILST